MNHSLSAWRRIGALWVGLAAALAVHAQDDVIAAASLTPEAVLQALDPDAVRARTLRIGASGATVPVRASASLLITFETNSAVLTPTARRQLDMMALAFMHERLIEYSFTVEGHADPRGNPDENLKLSQERAEAVKSYLVAARGIAGDRLMPEGRGDREPMRPAQPAAAENRRVTFITQARP